MCAPLSMCVEVAGNSSIDHEESRLGLVERQFLTGEPESGAR